MVRDYSNMDKGITTWEVQFRRTLREYEREILEHLIFLLKEFPIAREEEDEQIWAGDSSGAFIDKR